jgi:cephalosporin hydroxylase
VSDTFQLDKQRNIAALGRSQSLRQQSIDWITDASRHHYSHHFTWMGLPIIQFPQDIVAIQEIIFRVKPDLIIETGIARGGSLVFYASMLELLGGDRIVCGIDLDIRAHNRVAIESHRMARRIRLIEGSSTGAAAALQATSMTRGRNMVMVVLDSHHTHDHVLRELELYSPLVTRGSYLIVLDTIIEDMPVGYFQDRPWDVGDNPKTAVREFLQSSRRFEVDNEMDAKLLISVAPGGYLRCVAD